MRAALRPTVSARNALGHTRLTVTNYADAARHFAAWLRRTNIVLACVDNAVVIGSHGMFAAAVAADDVNGSPAAVTEAELW